MILQHPNGRAYPLSFYGETDNGQTIGRFDWDAETPECPHCTLDLLDDEDHAPMVSTHADDRRVVCQACGWEQEIA